MKKYHKITPEGIRDYLFEECLIHHHVEHRLEEVYRNRGFRQVVTPGLEFYDVFDPERSGIPSETMYKLTDRKGRLLVLRPDSTLPIARLTATRLQGQEKPRKTGNRCKERTCGRDHSVRGGAVGGRRAPGRFGNPCNGN